MHLGQPLSLLLVGCAAAAFLVALHVGEGGTDLPRVSFSAAPSQEGLVTTLVDCHHPRGGYCVSQALRSEEDGSSDRQKPLVVFLHGFPDTLRTFVPQMKALAESEEYDVIAPAIRGYDTDRKPLPTDMSLYEAALDVRAMLMGIAEERLKRRSPGQSRGADAVVKVHLVGHDWGSAVAQCVAKMIVAAPVDERRLVELRSVTLVSVPLLQDLPRALLRHPTQLRHSWYMAFFQLPWLPELWLRTRRPSSHHPGGKDAEEEAVMVLGGGITALLNSWGPKPYPSHRLVDIHRTLGNATGPLPSAAIGWYRANCSPLLLLPGWAVSLCEWLAGSRPAFAKTWHLIFSTSTSRLSNSALKKKKGANSKNHKHQKQSKKGAKRGVSPGAAAARGTYAAGAAISWSREVPVLMLVGEHDGCIPPATYDAAAADYLDAHGAVVKAHVKHTVVPGAGHFVHWDTPEVFEELVFGFIANASVPTEKSTPPWR